MKKRILALMLCALTVFMSIPLTSVGQLYSVNVAAEEVVLELDELRSAYEGVPDEDTWGDYTEATVSALKSARNYAIAILEGRVDGITQQDVDDCTESLNSAVSGLVKVTTSVGIFPNEETVSIDVGKSILLTAALGPEGASDSVEWSVSDDTLAKIEKVSDLEARVTALKHAPEGFTVTATAKSNGVTSSPRNFTTVNVLKGLTLSYGQKELYETQSFTLTYNVKGADESYPVTGVVVTEWSSSNSNVATVDDDGKVVAVSAGTAEISLTVEVAGNVKTAVCEVTVLDTVKITSLDTISTLTSGAISVLAGKEQLFSIRIKPANASIKNITWTSEKTNIATVELAEDTDEDDDVVTALITGVSAGKTKITYSATDGSGISGSFYVNVKPLATSIAFAEDFVLISPTTAGTKLSIDVAPDDADNTLTWKSSDPNICDVDRVGVLYPKTSGVVTITASTDDGSNLSDTVTVRVAEKTTSVKLNKDSVALNVGDTATLKATVESSTDGSVYNNVKWTTENSAIAKVSSSGKITAVGPGQTVITATALDTNQKYAACVVTVTQPLSGISITSTADVEIGGKKTLKVTYSPTNASNQTVTWKSSNTAVATVSSKGVVTGVKVGTATITCTSEEGSYKATCTVNVIIPAGGVSLNKTSLSLSSGDTYTLKATVTPSDATYKTVTWKSSNTSVATVSSAGKVTAKAGGTCTISATTVGGEHVAKCTVTVTQTDTGVELSSSTVSIYTTGTKTLTATVLPETATNKTVTWSSENEKIATVNSKGVVTGVRAGRTTIVATTASGNTASCLVEVYEKVSVTGFTLEPNNLEMIKGETVTLVTNITPSNASEKGITWTTSDKSIATVSGGTVKAVKTGKVTITAKTKDGGITQTCTITIIQPVTGISFAGEDIKLAKKKSCTLKPDIAPSDATNTNVTWYSTDEKVATVTSGGIVTGVKTGTATIIATTEDGAYSAACNVTVYIAVSGVKLSVDTSKPLTLPTGGESMLLATVSPSDAENTEVEWSSSNEKVAVVDETGHVTAKNPGTAKITVKTVDGGYKSSCTVEVVRYVKKITLSRTSITINAGKSTTITASVEPTTATDTTVKWKSSNKKVATVSSKGVVKAVAAGEATITCTSSDGNAKTYCAVKVTQPATGISVNKSSLTVNVGEMGVLSATIKPDDATDQKVTWSSSDKSVATVDSKGVVKGIKVGKATITAKTSDGKYSAKTTVTVIIPIKSVALSRTSVTLNVGKTSTLSYTVKPSNSTIKTVKWSSSNNDVATVSSSGKITAKAPGYARITCKTTQGGKTAYCEVLVIQPVTGIKINKTSFTAEAGKEYTLSASVLPANASNKTIKWSTSDKKIATVTSKGVVVGLKSGTVTITAKTSDGGYKAKCTVKVIKSVTGVALNKTTAKLYLGKTMTLKATITPSDATNKGLKWSSSDESIATVSSSGKVTPKKVGKVTITVKTSDGGYKAKCVINVMRAVEKITLNKSTMTLNVGKSYTLKATLTPSNATDKTVTWTTSNKAVATVDSKGVVKAVSKGTATITATTENGLKATFRLTVYQPVTGISLEKTAAEVYAGETLTLKAGVLPTNANNATIKWTSSDKNILTVSSSGVVTGKKAGIATVTATTDEGSYTAKCIVTVKQHVEEITLDKKEITLIKGRETDISVTVLPANATDKTYTIVSSDPTVATVDEKGHIISLECGVTQITVTSNENNKSATCSVFVVMPVSGISLNQSELTMFVHDETTLKATITPEDAHDKAVIWTSSDDAVVSVDENGKITALKSGEAVITATTNDGGFTAQCKVTTLQKAEGIEISDESLFIIRGEGAALTAQVIPADAYDKTFTWSSDNKAVADVDAEGNITTYAPGTAVITATSYVGSFTAKCTVTVHEPVTDMTIDCSEITLYKGETKQINATFAPENASDKTVLWASDDEAVATVDEKGVVTVTGKGTATITAVSKDNSEIVRSCTVTGLLHVESIATEKEEYFVYAGDTLSLGAYALPEGAENPKLLYYSNDKVVAPVSAEGIVTANAKGEAEITIVSEENPAITKVVTVRVLIHVSEVTLDKTEYTLNKGEYFTLTPTVSPNSADDKTVEWSSSDENVATVAGGVVTAVARGDAEIYAKSVDGGITAVCKVTVIQLPEEITFQKEEYDVQVGGNFTLEATVLPENTNDKSLTWESLNKDIATVDIDGTVRGIAVGEATVVAKTVAGNIEKSVKVNVLQLITDITADYSKEFLWVGQQVGIGVTVAPENATHKAVRWESLNPEVATVDENGIVTAVSAGKAQIAVAAERGPAVTYIDVEVRQQVTAISLDVTGKTLDTGEELTLIATVLPENAYDKTVRFVSDNTEVAQVGEDGTVKAVGPGSATITAVSSDESITSSCTLTVIRYIDSISFTESDIIIEKGDAKTLAVQYAPENATETGLTWVSSDESIISVDEKGEITALKGGVATVKAITVKEEIFAEITVTVDVKSESITLSEGEKTLYCGEEFTLTATILPEDTLNKTVIWSSSDDSIATVEDGKVTAIEDGTVTITAKAEDTSIEATCTVTVLKHASGVEISADEAVVYLGKPLTVEAVVLPEDASNKNVLWYSTDEKVATVEDGVITPVGKGYALITATTEDGFYSACIFIEVQRGADSLTLSETEKTVAQKEEFTLVAELLPEDTDNKKLIWESDNEEILKVVDGVVTVGTKAGTATVTVTADGNRELTAQCVITVKEPVTAVSFDKTQVALRQGETAELSAMILPEDATVKDLEWTVEGEDIAEIAVTGNKATITALSAGEAIITATGTDSGISASCTVKVYREIESLTLTAEKSEIYCGESTKVTYTANPEGHDEKLTYSVSDDSLISVDENGNVTAKDKAGTAKVIVTSDISGKTAECEITVKIAVTQVSLDKSEVALRRGETVEITATVLPEDATVKDLEWAVEGEDIAEIAVTGNKATITALSAGEAIITATGTDSGISASCTVKVYREIESLTLTAEKSEIKCGESTKVTYTANPEGHDEKLTYSVSDESLISVDENGNVTAKDKAGTAKVIVTSDISGKTAECEIKVNKSVEGITLNVTDANRDAYVGKTDSIAYTIAPDDASNQQVVWKSSDNDIAEVDINSGVITYKAEGEVTITVTTIDGAKEDSFTVTVGPAPISE